MCGGGGHNLESSFVGFIWYTESYLKSPFCAQASAFCLSLLLVVNVLLLLLPLPLPSVEQLPGQYLVWADPKHFLA